MPYWPPDSAPTEPQQMPAAPNAGPAPVPYGGPGWAIAPDMLAPVPDVSASPAAEASVLIGVTGANHVTESPLAAPNVNPYAAGAISPVGRIGDNDSGGGDIVAASVGDAVSNAMARLSELQGDTYGQGSRIGDQWDLPPRTSDGKITQGGGYYDPPRDYD